MAAFRVILMYCHLTLHRRPSCSPLSDGPRSHWTQLKGQYLKNITGFDEVSQVRSELGPSVEGHCYSSLHPCLSLRVSNHYFFKFRLLVIHNKIQYLDNTTTTEISRKYLFENPLCHPPPPPPPQRLSQIFGGGGGGNVECFCYDIDFGFGS